MKGKRTTSGKSVPSTTQKRLPRAVAREGCGRPAVSRERTVRAMATGNWQLCVASSGAHTDHPAGKLLFFSSLLFSSPVDTGQITARCVALPVHRGRKSHPRARNGGVAVLWSPRGINPYAEEWPARCCGVYRSHQTSHCEYHTLLIE